jgi:thioredoxin-like negative regulator of GroEL
VLERAALLFVFGVGLTAVVIVVRAWWHRRLRGLRTAGRAPLWSALGTEPDGRPAVVVFSTPGCTACRTAQYPAIEAVESQLGGTLRVMHVDIAGRPEVGRSLGVLTAPSTIVLDKEGRVESFNQGFTPAEQLLAQLSGLGVSPASGRSHSQPAR